MTDPRQHPDPLRPVETDDVLERWFGPAADDPPPVPRRNCDDVQPRRFRSFSQLGCVGAVLVSLAVWVLFIAIVVRVVGR